MLNWINRQTIETGLRYLLVALGGFAIAKGWVNAEQWAGLSGGLLTVALAIWGIVEANRTKVVWQGERVLVKDLTPVEQNAVRTAAETASGKKLKPLFGSK